MTRSSSPETVSRLRTIAAIALLAFGLGAMLQAQNRPPAARAGAAQPFIAVGGIQIVKIAAAGGETFGKPFNSDNGTKLVLWIKMPAGQGLIDIDEDASVLVLFSDDKGTDLGGKFESFPDEFKDGSGGTLEIQSSGIPAAGAARLNAEGSVGMTVASGTRTQKIANVRIEDGRIFTLGQAKVAVAEVSTEDEEQKFTLKLPRQALTLIKNVRFLDGRGRPLEGRRTGTGYFNDDGEMSLAVKTALKTMTLEFELWQGMRSIKVPFNVQAGVSLGG